MLDARQSFHSNFKILHVCESVIGGTGTYLNEMLTYQVKTLGAENVRLLVPTQQISHLDKSLLDKGVLIGYNRRSRIQGLLPLLKAYRQLSRQFQPDLIHAHSTFAGLLVRIDPKQSTKRIIYCPHGWAFDILTLGPMRPIYKLIEYLMAFRSRRIVAISRYEYDCALKIGIPEHKLALIRNGIALAAQPGVGKVWEDTRLKVFYAGRLDPQKGFDVLVDAIMGLEERVVVHVYGGGVISSKEIYPNMPHLRYFGGKTGK